MNKMGNRLREDELHALLADADVDGNGTIDYEEFVAATVNLNKLEKEEHCMQVLPLLVHAYTFKCVVRVPAVYLQLCIMLASGHKSVIPCICPTSVAVIRAVTSF